MQISGNASPQDREFKPEQQWLRLRDLISGLHSDHNSASNFIDRVHPDVADRLRAVVAHRGIRLADFVVEALMLVAFEAADAAWENAVRRRAMTNADPEAALLAHILDKAMRLHLQEGLMITPGELVGETARTGLCRVGRPFKPD